ncbi:MAG TPA: hypothetical protein P5337_06700 [Aestuariivirga sp.]|nr:hypothetical protein [Aestuariivirga sp.]
MFVPMSTLIALVLFGAFLWWVHSSEQAAKRKKELHDHESKLNSIERELKIAKENTEAWRKEAEGGTRR